MDPGTLVGSGLSEWLCKIKGCAGEVQGTQDPGKFGGAGREVWDFLMPKLQCIPIAAHQDLQYFQSGAMWPWKDQLQFSDQTGVNRLGS